MTLMFTTAMAEGITQYHKDAIREYHTKQVMGSAKELTTLQQDVVLFRKIFKKPNSVEQQALPEPDAVPWVQIYKKTDLSFGNTLTLAAQGSGYDAIFHPSINQSLVVKLNSQANSLVDIAEYLSRVTNTDISVYPESRVVLVTQKVR